MIIWSPKVLRTSGISFSLRPAGVSGCDIRPPSLNLIAFAFEIATSRFRCSIVSSAVMSRSPLAWYTEIFVL